MTAYRSKFEGRVGGALPAGTQYEPKQFKFSIKDPGYLCGACGSKDITRATTYTPDFLLPNGTWIEAKGRLDGYGRRKLVTWRKAFPSEKLRLVFMCDNWLSKGAKSRYSDWAKKEGFEYCVGVLNIPTRWFK